MQTLSGNCVEAQVLTNSVGQHSIQLHLTASPRACIERMFHMQQAHIRWAHGVCAVVRTKKNMQATCFGWHKLISAVRYHKALLAFIQGKICMYILFFKRPCHALVLLHLCLLFLPCSDGSAHISRHDTSHRGRTFNWITASVSWTAVSKIDLHSRTKDSEQLAQQTHAAVNHGIEGPPDYWCDVDTAHKQKHKRCSLAVLTRLFAW